MILILVILVPLIVLLYVLIFSMTQAKHFAPQAYHRRKAVGAPLAFDVDALGPRPRRLLPPDEPEDLH